MDKIMLLKKMIDESDNIVVFTGAGVSTDSGLRDFRSKNGLYKEKTSIYPPEYMLSSDCFYNHTEEFYEYYKDNFNCLDTLPNDTHKFIKKLEDIGKLSCVITQNIDGLHTKAGNKKVFEVHGTIYKNHCIKCNKIYDANYIFNSKGVPKCTCGGIIKPNVVLYGESLPDEDYIGGINAIKKADMLIVCGSSLTVYPAAGMVDNFHGKYLVIINNEKTLYDSRANLVINDNLAKVSKELLEVIE
jgi:NAD-dependent deacetylase